jgi:hypothetical protein
VRKDGQVKNVISEKTSVKQEEESNILPINYGCEIIYENATREQQKDKNIPSDSKLVKYQIDNIMGKHYLLNLYGCSFVLLDDEHCLIDLT